MTAAFVLVSLASAPSGAWTPYVFETHKNNTVTVIREDDRTVFVVTNPFGIGQMKATLKAARWPANVTLRFRRHAGKDGGFASLEHIQITTDRVHAAGNLTQSGHFPFGFLGDRGEKPAGDLDDRWTAGELKVVVEERDGAIEVTLPPRLLTGSTRFAVSWIDAYRR